MPENTTTAEQAEEITPTPATDDTPPQREEAGGQVLHLPAPGPSDDYEPSPPDDDEPEEEEEHDAPEGGVPAAPLLANAVNLSTVGVCGALSTMGPVAALVAGGVAAAGVGALGVSTLRSTRSNAQRRAAAATTTAAGRLGRTSRGSAAAGGVSGGGGRGGAAGRRMRSGAAAGGRAGHGGGRGGLLGRRGAGAGSGGLGAGRGGAQRQSAALGGAGRGGAAAGRGASGLGSLGLGKRLAGASGGGANSLGGRTGSGSGGAGRGARRGSAGGGGRHGAAGAGGVFGGGRRRKPAAGASSIGAGAGSAGRSRGAGRETVAAARGRAARLAASAGERLAGWRESAGTWLRVWGAKARAWVKSKLGWAWSVTKGLRRRGYARLRHYLRLAAAAFFATVAALAVMPASLFVGALANIPAAVSKRFRFTNAGMSWPGRVARKVFGKLADASRRRLNSQLVDMAQPITSDAEHVGHVCDDPGATTGPVTEEPTTRGEHVSVFATSAEEVANAYAAYDPPAMAAVAAEYKGLPDAIRFVNDAVMALAENSATIYPMDPAMAEGVAQVSQVLEATAAYADEIEPTFRTVHEHDVMRLENPRVNEHWWNVGGIDGDGALWATASVLATAAEEVRGVYQSWSPEGMGDSAAMAVGAEYEGLPVGLEHLADAVTSLATRSADTYPVDPCIAEMVADVVHGLRKAISAAMELQPAFRRLHSEEIDHNENPRNGEHMWAAPKNGGASA
ncbi:hypothetical protein ACIGW8_10145 [Streptomyces sioyaensis]|uniref:hypothetical protein n=1 Tax=Streptomyces sioyaensis TaxID=67364 RepID=UPI0037D1F21F